MWAVDFLIWFVFGNAVLISKVIIIFNKFCCVFLFIQTNGALQKLFITTGLKGNGRVKFAQNI